MDQPDKIKTNATLDDLDEARKDMDDLMSDCKAFAIVTLDEDQMISSLFFWPKFMLPALRKYVHEAITGIESGDDVVAPISNQVH